MTNVNKTYGLKLKSASESWKQITIFSSRQIQKVFWTKSINMLTGGDNRKQGEPMG